MQFRKHVPYLHEGAIDAKRLTSLPSPGKGSCLAQPAKSVPRSLLVNRFAVLDVEEVNTDICELIDVPPLSPSTPDRTAQLRKPKWEKRLPK